MLETRTEPELRKLIQAWKQEACSIALVPTMGNLHAGHLALVRKAKQLSDRVVTSIFVNPTQFAANDDLTTYPRTPEADRISLHDAGCDLLFSPGSETIYPVGLENAIRLSAPADLTSTLEGEFRPEHFAGVVTVVSRLFNLVTPDIAVFGEKDYQQLLVVRRLVDDLGYGIRIHSLPTVREQTGLAMSSRNGYLDVPQKQAAKQLYAVLKATRELALKSGADFIKLEKRAMKNLKKHGLIADYFAIRRADDLALPGEGDRALRILVAAWCGKTRLIDNMDLHLNR